LGPLTIQKRGTPGGWANSHAALFGSYFFYLGKRASAQGERRAEGVSYEQSL